MSRIWKLFGLVVISVCVMSVGSCQQKGHDKKVVTSTRIITVKEKQPQIDLHYKGTLQPIQIESVVSPVEGRVRELKFAYGQYVKQGQLLALLKSDKLADDFDKSITDYFKQKNTYQTGQLTWQGAQMLYKAGVNPKSTYITDKTTQETNKLSLYQSRLALEKILKKVHIKVAGVEKLTLSSTQRVTEKFRSLFNSIPVTATGTGVALYPLPNQDGSSSGSGGSSDSTGKLQVGTEVKEGQLMLSIGDLSGYTVEFNVSEIEVGELKKDFPVTVTGDAFPGVTLHGTIASVATQANPDQGGGQALSQFKVQVEVPVVSKAASHMIRVGMTCQIHLTIKQSAKVMIPLAAIKLVGGRSMVTKVDASGKQIMVNVTTGYSSPQGDVVVLTGLKSGDKVVVHD